MKKIKTLIIGVTGMLGHTLYKRLFQLEDLSVYATARSLDGLSQWFPDYLLENIEGDVDANRINSIEEVLDRVKPDIVINCVGIIKQLPEGKDPVISISINSLFPHLLARACEVFGARMIHISTDCVFAGDKGNYKESDLADARDLYGRSKSLGEVAYRHCLTLRTSIIGHELKGKHGLIEWFLAQNGIVRGFAKAIYSGFPTIEIAGIIANHVIPNTELNGLYHVSSAPVSKYDLLQLVARWYEKNIEIERDTDFVLDRSLDSSRFREETGYNPPSWPELIDAMYKDHINTMK